MDESALLATPLFKTALRRVLDNAMISTPLILLSAHITNYTGAHFAGIHP